MISNHRVTHENHFQDTRLVELNIGNEISYNPGDVCLVQPSNSKANVNKFLELFAHLEPDKSFTLISNDDENIELPPKSVLRNNRTTLRYIIKINYDKFVLKKHLWIQKVIL